MTVQIPDMTPLIVVFVVAVALTLATLATVAVGFLSTNRRIRIARRERVLPYYGHLVLGH